MEGGATSPLGVFMLTTAFCCDLISFIPVFGPIISVITISTLLFLFKDELKPPAPESPEEEQKEDEETPESDDATPNQEDKITKENNGNQGSEKSKTKEAAPPKNQSGPTIELAPSKMNSLLSQFSQGGLKGMGKKLIIGFLIRLIPIIGPIVASYTVTIWQKLK